jgi:hypothetical protein
LPAAVAAVQEAAQMLLLRAAVRVAVQVELRIQLAAVFLTQAHPLLVVLVVSVTQQVAVQTLLVVVLAVQVFQAVAVVLELTQQAQ